MNARELGEIIANLTIQSNQVRAADERTTGVSRPNAAIINEILASVGLDKIVVRPALVQLRRRSRAIQKVPRETTTALRPG